MARRRRTGVSGPDDTTTAGGPFAALEHDGWTAIPDVLKPDAAAELAARCASLLDDGGLRQGDKSSGGTHRAAAVLERLPEVREVVEHPDVRRAVDHLLGPGVPVADVAFRCPQPGFGHQSLHADDLPIEHAGVSRGVTAIVALVSFTATNGSTAVVPGSHRRPDLQRRPDQHGLAGHEVRLEGAAGTVFVFSSHLLHRGTRNVADRPRPALQVIWRAAPPPTTGAGTAPRPG